MIPNFSKYSDGLVPAIVQDDLTGKVLMLGFMDEAAWKQTQQEKKVTFFSRSKQRLWTKGESSGHFLRVREMLLDCDEDTILVRAEPDGPVCHTGAATCFNEPNERFTLPGLEEMIADRIASKAADSYTANLFAAGINKIAQKLGEEAVELVIESKDHNDQLFLNEAADLLFHYLILLQAKGLRLQDVTTILASRQKK